MATSETTALLPPAEPWWQGAFMVTFAFRCNLACPFCMVEDVLGVLPGVSLDALAKIAWDPMHPDGERLRAARRIVFSGGEVTLAKDLVAYVRFARSLPAVEHVRLQTNAVRLADRAYLDALVEAGVDELFVSLHAPDEALGDRLAGRTGAFRQILDGLRAISDAGVALTTNTCVVAANHDRLVEIVELAASFGARGIELWSYWPRADEDNHRDLAAPVAAVRPHLVAAVEASLARGVAPVVKWFPRCLLGPYARYHDDGQPAALLDDRYWAREPAYACLWDGVCVEAQRGCAGLAESYVRRFGWEESLLAPRRDGREAATANVVSVEARSLVRDVRPAPGAAAAVDAWLARLGLVGFAVGEWRLVAAAPGRAAAMLVLTFARAGDAVEVRVLPSDRTRRVFARTRSFDFTFAPRSDGERIAEAAAALTRDVARHVAARDPGDLVLPA